MQVTIEIPDDLARQLESERENLAQIIERGLGLTANTGLAQEVAEFLARGPQPREIVAFRPSAASAERVGDLLDKNRERILTTGEKAELDELMEWNRVFSLIKAQARLRLPS